LSLNIFVFYFKQTIIYNFRRLLLSAGFKIEYDRI